MAYHIVEAVTKDYADCVLAFDKQIFNFAGEVHNQILLEGVGYNNIARIEFGACSVVGLIG